jgi:AraC-like DNA-binding protein
MVDLMVALFQADPSLTGKEVSQRLGLSVSRLARLFKQQMGVSIVVYRNRLRFERFFAQFAEEASREGRRRPTLRQAARTAGFGSYAHFHRLFRAQWSTGPRDGFRSGVVKGAPAPRPARPSPPDSLGGIARRPQKVPLIC